MKTIKTILAAASLSVLAACTYPTSSVTQGGAQNSLYFTSAPAGARVVLDGVDMGEAAGFDGQKAVLGVASGTHKVTVISGNSTLYDRQVFVGTGSRVEVKVQ